MLDRDGSTFVASCDFCCSESLDIGEHDFLEAVAWLKEQGWKIFKQNGEWHHKGPDCIAEENEVEFDDETS